MTVERVSEEQKNKGWAPLLIIAIVVGTGVAFKDDPAVKGAVDKVSGQIKNALSEAKLIQTTPSIANYLTNYTEPGGTPEADTQIANVARYDDYTSFPIGQFNQLLSERRYEELEALYREQEALILDQHLAEVSYAEFLLNVNAKQGVSLAELNAWVDATESEFSYVARSAYYSAAAWQARGSAFAAETSDAQWKSFRSIAGFAAKDVLAATGINGRSYAAYLIFSRLLGTKALPMSGRALADAMNELFPWSYRLRWSYIHHLAPRWSGSFKQMDEYALEVLEYLPTNPQLWLMQGVSHAEKGKIAHSDGNYPACLEAMNVALSYGVQSSWLRRRADCLEHLQEYEFALRDIEMSLDIAVSEESLQVRDKIYANMPSE